MDQNNDRIEKRNRKEKKRCWKTLQKETLAILDVRLERKRGNKDVLNC